MVAASASAFLGAVPLVTTLIPVIQTIEPTLAAQAGADPDLVRQALWWSLALGACLGGNGTLVGTAANVVAVEIARNNRHEISFARFMAYGMPIMVISITISSVYILLRYVLYRSLRIHAY